MRRPRPLLAATLIVRDEAHQLAECLAALAGVADEMVVYDTGSRDDTREVARRAGARVLAGYWDDDFARARNEALRMTRADWALAVDADERLAADGPALRALLRDDHRLGAVGGLTLKVDSRAGDGRLAASHVSLRLFRPDGARWEGRVHEVLRLGRPGQPGQPEQLRAHVPPPVARLDHLGYRDAATVGAKAERNLALVQAELDRLHATGSDDVAAASRVLFDLARSALEVGYRQLAVDALETLRELVPHGTPRTLAAGLLAQILLDEPGFEEAALVLEAELRADRAVDARFADWIRARALAGLGRPREALVLLCGIDRLVDPAGVEQPLGPVLRARAALAAQAGCLENA